MRLGNLYENKIAEILDADQNPVMKDLLEQRVKILNKCLVVSPFYAMSDVLICHILQAEE